MTEHNPREGVRVLVGWPEGGPMDIAARLIGSALSIRLDQSFVVKNFPGESGNMATHLVVQAPPDGLTLLLCGPVNAINTTLFPDLDFDFIRDIRQVAALWRVPLIVEVTPLLGISTVPELLAMATRDPGKLRVAYAGRGTPQHMGIELFKMMAGVALTLVPYLGSTPALEALLSGEAQVMFDPMPSSIDHVRNGRLIPLAVTSMKRSTALPDVPSMDEFIPGYEAGSWFGIGVPRNTPEHIVSTLNREINAAMADEELKSQLATMGATPFTGSPEDFEVFIALEIRV